jgi:hypothetical protein
MKRLLTLPALVLWKTFFWTYERATWQYDLLVLVILAFIWLTPPGWLKDPTATGPGLVGLIERLLGVN